MQKNLYLKRFAVRAMNFNFPFIPIPYVQYENSEIFLRNLFAPAQLFIFVYLSNRLISDIPIIFSDRLWDF